MTRTTGLVVLLFLSATSFAEDWRGWLGNHRDGVWRESGILEKFPDGGPKVLWRKPVNQGYSGPAVVGDRVYLMDRKVSDPSKAPENAFKRGRIPGNERILCLDAATGGRVWERAYDCDYTVSYSSGPRVTPTVDGDRVYTLGAEGRLLCLATKDGSIRWEHTFTEKYGIRTPMWGFSASPLIEGDLLICLAGGDGTTAVAFDKMTGEQKWAALTAKEPGYCSPRVVEHAGRRLLIIWDPEAANALDPKTGKVHWSIPWEIRAGLSIPTPQIVGDHLLFTSFYNGSMMVKLKDDNSTPEIVWRTEKASEKRTTHLHSIMTTPLFKDGHIYGPCSYGEFRCLEAKTGKRVWESLEPLALKRPVRWGTAFITPLADTDRQFLFTEKGDLVITRLNPKGYEEIDRAHVIAPNCVDLRQRDVVWSHPAYARQCVFVRNDTEIVCLSLAR